jgi:GrpB-like predicted nucleotidyltransferase (UPF0157 family)
MGQMRNIVVVRYDPIWIERFHREAALITAIFGAELLAIHHIGSTAIPGLSAKPIIDIMPLVSSIQNVDTLNAAMTGVGYEPLGEYGIVGRRFFVKGGDATRTHHVHSYEPGHPEVPQHLDFRDYLAAHPAEAQQYASLKAKLAEQYRDDIDSYMRGKDAFIKSILVQAQEWRTKQKPQS